MVKVFVDSGSSIKQEEKEKYGVEIIPLKVLIKDKEYLDGVDLTIDEFYNLLDKKSFPKTSLPNLVETKEKVENETKQGNDVIILTISAEISGEYNALKLLFEDNSKVRVVDTKSVVGGIRILVEEINKYKNNDIDFILEKINNLIPKIKIIAIPETLDYLLKGGRLSKTEWLFGTILNIKPITSIIDGKVKVLTKKIGINNSIKFLASSLENFNCDENYPIIASYTKDRKNLDKLISSTNQKFVKLINSYDNLDPVIASHWGENAFGYVFVSK